MKGENGTNICPSKEDMRTLVAKNFDLEYDKPVLQ